MPDIPETEDYISLEDENAKKLVSEIFERYKMPLFVETDWVKEASYHSIDGNGQIVTETQKSSDPGPNIAKVTDENGKVLVSSDIYYVRGLEDMVVLANLVKPLLDKVMELLNKVKELEAGNTQLSTEYSMAVYNGTKWRDHCRKIFQAMADKVGVPKDVLAHLGSDLYLYGIQEEQQ